jgi:hypothetical protein
MMTESNVARTILEHLWQVTDATLAEFKRLLVELGLHAKAG